MIGLQRAWVALSLALQHMELTLVGSRQPHSIPASVLGGHSMMLVSLVSEVTTATVTSPSQVASHNAKPQLLSMTSSFQNQSHTEDSWMLLSSATSLTCNLDSHGSQRPWAESKEILLSRFRLSDTSLFITADFSTPANHHHLSQ